MLSCVADASSLRDALVRAVRRGGDTDTVAALTGGLIGCRLTVDQVQAAFSWHTAVNLPEPENALAETATALATIRAVHST